MSAGSAVLKFFELSGSLFALKSSEIQTLHTPISLFLKLVMLHVVLGGLRAASEGRSTVSLSLRNHGVNSRFVEVLYIKCYVLNCDLRGGNVHLRALQRAK